jgi:hypothetical protein
MPSPLGVQCAWFGTKKPSDSRIWLHLYQAAPLRGARSQGGVPAAGPAAPTTTISSTMRSWRVPANCVTQPPLGS